MDKSNHRITVDREYLEELEKFKEQHEKGNNAKLAIKNLGGFSYGIFVKIDDSLNHSSVQDIETLIITGKHGEELARFRKVL